MAGGPFFAPPCREGDVLAEPKVQCHYLTTSLLVLVLIALVFLLTVESKHRDRNDILYYHLQ